MMVRPALWLALQLVRVAGVLVPRAGRAQWMREWEAELRQHAVYLRKRRHPTWTMNMGLVQRALGALPDAAWIRRQFTLAADAIHDAGHALRVLATAPGFAATTLLVFAVGIGASTAIVSVADALFIRPLAVTQPDRVMTVWQFNRETAKGRLDVAPGNAIDWSTRARSFDAVGLAEPYMFNLNLAGREPDYIVTARVTEPFFTALGTPPLHGRLFLSEEYRRGAGRVVILSHELWSSRFGGDPSIVGRSVRLEGGVAYTVVGIRPAGLELRLFHDNSGARRPETRAWMPKQGFEDADVANRSGAFWNVVARLRRGVSIEEARAELGAISAQLAREFPQSNARISAEVVPLRAHLIGSLGDVLPLLLAAAAMLLIVACANVATLLLARGAARGREFAVRQALGASRVRLVRQMLVESLLLAVAGGSIGLILTRWTLDLIGRLKPQDIALVDRIPIDGRAAAIAFGVTIVAAVIAGLTPALHLSRPSAVNALREGRASARRGVRGALVVVEVAAAVVITVGAGLFVRSFILIQRVDPGFSRDDVSVLQLFSSPRTDTPAKRVVFYQQVLDRLSSLPGVLAAGAVTSMPFAEARVIVRGPLTISGRPPASGESALVYTSAVSGDYFRVMDVPLIAGRLFDRTDTPTSRQVALVSRRAAEQFWHGEDPVRSRIGFRFYGQAYDAEVVGVVGDVRHEALDRQEAAEVFLPYAQAGSTGLSFVVRTASASPVSLQAMKEQVWSVDPIQTVYSVGRLDQLISKTLAGQRFNLFVLGGFALATLLLASAGVYGVMSSSTIQRTQEFGVRLALGATGRDIIGLVLGEGLKLTGLGVMLGVVFALLLARFVRQLLFGVTSRDPLTFAVVTLTLMAVAAAASYLPASRALKIDPSMSLRTD